MDTVRGLRSVDVPEPALGTVQLGYALHDLWENRALDLRGPHAPMSTGVLRDQALISPERASVRPRPSTEQPGARLAGIEDDPPASL